MKEDSCRDYDKLVVKYIDARWKRPLACGMSHCLFAVLVSRVLGQCQQDHGELLLANLAIFIEVAASQDGFLELFEVLSVVVL